MKRATSSGSTTASTPSTKTTHVVLSSEPVQKKQRMDDEKVDLSCLAHGMPAVLPVHPGLDESVPHAPRRPAVLTQTETKLALKNALRYFPKHQHDEIAPELAEELEKWGHIYANRLRPTSYTMRAYPLSRYPARTKQAGSIMLMIQNNLDPAVAQYPHELITYGGNGSVFSNWAQYHLVMKYLAEMTEEQTLVCYSGHPLGLFPSHKDAPRMVITNGMVIPNYSSREMYEKMYATGVSQYGQAIELSLQQVVTPLTAFLDDTNRELGACVQKAAGPKRALFLPDYLPCTQCSGAMAAPPS